jgi:hypothetical protein
MPLLKNSHGTSNRLIKDGIGIFDKEDAAVYGFEEIDFDTEGTKSQHQAHAPDAHS